MTPTHLSMSHEGKETLRQIVEATGKIVPSHHSAWLSTNVSDDDWLAVLDYVAALEADLDAVTTYAAVLEAALEQICTDAKRVDVYSNGALLDLVQPFLIDRARAALKGDANG